MKLAMAERCILRKKKKKKKKERMLHQLGIAKLGGRHRRCRQTILRRSHAIISKWKLACIGLSVPGPSVGSRSHPGPLPGKQRCLNCSFVFIRHTRLTCPVCCVHPFRLLDSTRHLLCFSPIHSGTQAWDKLVTEEFPNAPIWLGGEHASRKMYIPATTYPLDTNLRLLSTGQRSWSTMRSFALACNCLTEARTAHEIAQRRDGTGCLVIPEAQHHAYLH